MKRRIYLNRPGLGRKSSTALVSFVSFVFNKVFFKWTGCIFSRCRCSMFPYLLNSNRRSCKNPSQRTGYSGTEGMNPLNPLSPVPQWSRETRWAVDSGREMLKGLVRVRQKVNGLVIVGQVAVMDLDWICWDRRGGEWNLCRAVKVLSFLGVCWLYLKQQNVTTNTALCWSVCFKS